MGHCQRIAGGHASGAFSLPACVVTVGAFDGVHRGHQELILEAIRQAHRLGVPSVAYTFDPPPKAALCDIRQLTSLEEKLERMNALGVDHVIVASFDEAYRSRTAREFIDEIAALNPRSLVIGPDFRFGCHKDGDIAMLQRHFHTKVVPAVLCRNGEVVSSTRIRHLRASGRHDEAKRLEGWTLAPQLAGALSWKEPAYV